MNSIPFNTTTAQQYSSSPGASGYKNSQYVNANTGMSPESQEQRKNALRDSNFPELLLQAESQLKLQLQNTSNDELRKLAEDEDFLDEFLSRNLVIRELDCEVEKQIDTVEETASKLQLNYNCILYDFLTKQKLLYQCNFLLKNIFGL